MPVPLSDVLSDVLIDDVTWGCATRARRAEWQQTISELCQDAAITSGAKGPLRGYLTVDKVGILLCLHDSAGHEVGRLDLPQQVIAPMLGEYMGIVRELLRSGRSTQSPQFEALDIAKRLTHDDAAELLQRHFHQVTADHQTARRLFTLLVVITHDTTRLGNIKS